MKRFILCLVLAGLLVLFGCGNKDTDTGSGYDLESTPDVQNVPDAEGAPQDGVIDGAPLEEPSAPAQEEVSTLTPEQEEAELNLKLMSVVEISIRLMYTTENFPVFYPVGDDTLNSLRDMLVRVNEEFGELVFDIYSIEPCVYGYSVDLTFPVDYLGNTYRVWFEVLPDDTVMPRTTLVAPGPDGVVKYQGAGVDYTGINIGDDVIKFIDYAEYY